MSDFTTEQLETLNAAIAKGVKKVKYADREVEYGSIDEMLRVRDLMRKELGLANSTTRLFATHSKGLDGCG